MLSLLVCLAPHVRHEATTDQVRGQGGAALENGATMARHFISSHHT